MHSKTKTKSKNKTFNKKQNKKQKTENDKRPLSTCPPTPRLLCKFKY